MKHLIIDAGTTNARVTLIDEAGKVLGCERRDAGVRNTAIDGHNGRLKDALRESVGVLLAKNGLSHGDIGVCVAYGMITSNVGLLEIPHCAAPADARTLRDALVRRVFPEIAPFAIDFIPGVRNFSGPVTPENAAKMDMMRGEETEAVGLFHLLNPGCRCTLVLPGSHNKFIAMGRSGEILGCMTAISGELLDALTHHTILADAVDRRFVSSESYDRELMLSGLRAGLECGVGRAAFTGRILRTLAGWAPPDAANYLLGVTLSADILALRAFHLRSAEDALFVAGKPPLQQALCDALTECGFRGIFGVPAALSSSMGVTGARIIHGEMGI